MSEKTTETALNESEKATYQNTGVWKRALPQHFGREVIYTDYDEITPDNLLDTLSKALCVHNGNQQDIDYLWEYYKGKQDILDRPKDDVNESNNLIVENHAFEIVTFKTGYLLQNPVKYVPLVDNREEEISILNRYVQFEGKAKKDKEIADWMHICGTAYNMCLPDKINEVDYAPFRLDVLDPRNTFVVYHNGLGNEAMMGVTIKVLNDGVGHTIYSGYTKNHYFEVEDNRITRWEGHLLKEVPIIEYPLNQGRIGAFEIVLPLLESINKTASDRQNGLENFIHSLLVLKNVDLDDGDFSKIKVLGGLSISDVSEGKHADVEYLTQKLDQGDTQTLIDHEYKTLLRIVGMPFMNMSGAGSSDNGVAVELRDGYFQADTYAQNTTLNWIESEKRLIKLMLHLCKTNRKFNLQPFEIEPRLERWNRSNLLVKSQVLTTMLSNEKIHPRLAFQASDMFIDPELAYQQSMEWYENNKEVANDIGKTEFEQTINRRNREDIIPTQKSSDSQN